LNAHVDQLEYTSQNEMDPIEAALLQEQAFLNKNSQKKLKIDKATGSRIPGKAR